VSRRLSALELVDVTLDDGSFVRWDTEPVTVVADEVYAAELDRARERSGLDEAVITGEGMIRGRRVALIACEFAFLQMVKISAAVAAHKAAGLNYLVYLRNPTTGGVLVSWGSLGHVTVAEPGALVGFLGPRVYEALYSETFPPGVQVSENLFAHGLVDAVLPPEDLAAITDRALNVLLSRREGLPEATEPPREELADAPAWESITRSRRDDRPGIRRLLRYAATDIVPLGGTGEGETDPGLMLVLARFGGAPCVLLGQDRRGQTLDRPMGPAALREARRGIRLARELRLPLVTVIDSPAQRCRRRLRRAVWRVRSPAVSPSWSPLRHRPLRS